MRYYEIADRPRPQSVTDRITRGEPRHHKTMQGNLPSSRRSQASRNIAKAPWAAPSPAIPSAKSDYDPPGNVSACRPY